MKAALLMVGDELLIGQVVDTNAAWLASQLWELGIPVVRKMTVSDKKEEILHGLEECLRDIDLLIMTGGLGPTKDDITKKALADHFGVQMVFSEETFKRIKTFFQDLGKPWNELHRLQSYMPSNAELLENSLGTAPGMMFRWNSKAIYSLPGVPYEMKGIFNRWIKPELKEKIPESHQYYRTIRTIGIGESDLAELLESLPEGWDSDVSVAYLPNIGQVRVRISASGSSGYQARDRVDAAAVMVREILKPWVFGEDNDSLEVLVGKLLKEKGWMLGTAESCTGGLLAHTITTVPGSSSYFKGSVVAYSNEIKRDLLQVPSATLEEYGAVSEQTVRAMVNGAIQALDVDIAVAISGIAGPDGGTPEKPVGLIYLACGSRDEIRTLELRLNKDRLRNMEYAVTMGLNMIRKFLMGL